MYCTFLSLCAFSLSVGFLQKDRVTNLLKECAKMKEFNHPNVLALVGVCLDGGPAPYVIMPYMARGSLLCHLRKHRERFILSSSNVTENVSITCMAVKLNARV
jgi:serine/threonine protein kinase